jgi:hypothetical protein
MVAIGIHGNFISLLTSASGAQKWEVFAQFWEAECAPASHLFIDYQ